MRTVLSSVFCVLLLSVSAWSQDRDTLLQDCPTVSSCLAIIEPTLPERDNGRIFGDEQRVASVLKARFGREARDELLKKAVGDHGGWRNYAGGVLSYWNDWSEEDVPIVSQALALNPGSLIAHVLAEIGSGEAIEALFDSVTRSGVRGQTMHALRNLGPTVLNYALPSLSVPSYDELPEDAKLTEGWRAVAGLIGSYGSQALFIADDWIAVANNRREASSTRVAALRGLGAMGGHLGEKSVALRRLLRSRDRGIADQAYTTLVSVYDPTVARRFAAACEPSGERWDPYVFSSRQCLDQLSSFGSNARDAGDLILPFLASINKEEQLYGIEALGLIGYEPAIPKIETFLESPDWRLVYASVRALSQMQSKTSVPKIETAARRHWWLWELEAYAWGAVSLLIRNQPYSEYLSSSVLRSFHNGFGNYDPPFDTRRECEAQVWGYRGEELTFEQVRNRETLVSLRDGDLIGTNNGEFGGNLTWRAGDGDEVVLVDVNTIDLFPIDGGFISIHGLHHMVTNYGFAVHIQRTEDGGFRAEEIARFPAATYQVKKVSEGRFAANAGGRVFIFSKEGIEDVVYCGGLR